MERKYTEQEVLERGIMRITGCHKEQVEKISKEDRLSGTVTEKKPSDLGGILTQEEIISGANTKKVKYYFVKDVFGIERTLALVEHQDGYRLYKHCSMGDLYGPKWTQIAS